MMCMCLMMCDSLCGVAGLPRMGLTSFLDNLRIIYMAAMTCRRVRRLTQPTAVSIYKIGWGAEPTGGPPSTGPPHVPI